MTAAATLRVVAYEPRHAYEVMARNSVGNADYFSSVPNWEEWAKKWKDAGPSYTVMANDSVVACGGIALSGWGTGEAWMLASPIIRRFSVFVIRELRRRLPYLMTHRGLRRIQAVADASHLPSRKLLLLLGFEDEGRMKKYGPRGEMMILCSIVR